MDYSRLTFRLFLYPFSRKPVQVYKNSVAIMFKELTCKFIYEKAMEVIHAASKNNFNLFALVFLGPVLFIFSFRENAST